MDKKVISFTKEDNRAAIKHMKKVFNFSSLISYKTWITCSLVSGHHLSKEHVCCSTSLLLQVVKSTSNGLNISWEGNKTLKNYKNWATALKYAQKVLNGSSE